MITLKNVTKIMDNNVILDNINLNLEEGKIYGLVGRNGSGKSILLKVICGFLKPTEGIVLVDNKDLAKEPVFPESIAALIERPNYIPDLNAFDNLFMIASIKNIIGQKEIEDTLKLVNLANDNKSFKKYSLGMKQKLGIAQVLMEKPKIVYFNFRSEENARCHYLHKIGNVLITFLKPKNKRSNWDKPAKNSYSY